MADRTLLNRAALARRLGRTMDWLYKNEARLVEKHGFPTPVPGMGARYDPAAIDAWLNRQIAGERITGGVPIVAPMELEAEAAELDRRSAALATRAGVRRHA